MATKATKKDDGFSAEEKAAMKERAKELKAQGKKADGEKQILDRIAEMPEPDKSLATRIHAIVKDVAPQLKPKTWYGMPAYADANDKIVCFFQDADKFKARYATLGFNDAAMLDDGDMWAASFAVKKIGPAEEKRIIDLVKKAVG